MIEIPALNMSGLTAKAEIARHEMLDVVAGKPPDQHETLILSLLDDIERIADGAELYGDDNGNRPRSPAMPGLSLCELHRRWSALTDEIDAIEIEVEEVMEQREGDGWPSMTDKECELFPANIEAQLRGIGRSDWSSNNEWREAELRRRLADIEANPAKYAPLQAAAKAAYSAREAEFHAKAARHGLMPKIDRQRAAKTELKQVRDAIWETPAATIADVAALVDIALRKSEMVTPGADTVWEDWPYWCLLTRRLHALAPEVEFAWLTHPVFTADDLVAEVLGDPDDAPAAKPA